MSWHCLCVERPSRGRAAAVERGRLVSLRTVYQRGATSFDRALLISPSLVRSSEPNRIRLRSKLSRATPTRGRRVSALASKLGENSIVGSCPVTPRVRHVGLLYRENRCGWLGHARTTAVRPTPVLCASRHRRGHTTSQMPRRRTPRCLSEVSSVGPKRIGVGRDARRGGHARNTVNSIHYRSATGGFTGGSPKVPGISPGSISIGQGQMTRQQLGYGCSYRREQSYRCA